VLGRPSADQTEYFLARVTLGKKKQKNKKKNQNSETLSPQPIKSFSMLHYTKKARGLQHQCWLQTCLGDIDKQDWMLKE
jgi:hypothetical protein